MLFFALALANLAFFAWWRYGPPADAADTAPLMRQIEPEKLKVLGPADLPPPTAAKSEKLGPSSAGTGRCIEWGSFTLADAARAELALEPLAPPGKNGLERDVIRVGDVRRSPHSGESR